MNQQRGGSFTVSGYLALTLLALCAAEAATISYLFRHRAIQINMSDIPFPGQIHSVDLPDTVVTPDSDMYVTHTFPERRGVCTFTNTICHIKI